MENKFLSLLENEKNKIIIWYNGINPTTGKSIIINGKTWTKIGRTNEYFNYLSFLKENPQLTILPKQLPKPEKKKKIIIIKEEPIIFNQLENKTNEEQLIISSEYQDIIKTDISTKPVKQIIKQPKKDKIKKKSRKMKENEMTEFDKIFHEAHVLLRNEEGLTGMDAMKEITQLFILKLIEVFKKSFNTKIIPDSYETILGGEPYTVPYLTFSDIDKKGELTETKFKYYETNIDIIKHLPQLKTFIATNDGTSKIKKFQTVSTLSKLIQRLEIEKHINDFDLTGNMYEHFLEWELQMASDLGQYFTDRKLINTIVSLIPFPDNPKIADFACGTGGFLTQAIYHMNSSEKKIPFKNEDIIGIELSQATFPLTYTNMLMTFKGQPESIFNFNAFNFIGSLTKEKDAPGSQIYVPKYNSITKESTFKIIDKDFVQSVYGKLDIILMNPPFGSKIAEGEDKNILGQFMDQQFKKKYAQTKDIMFLFYAYLFLKEGGYCGIVLPTGIGSNSTMKKYREFLTNHTQITNIISIPSGIFRNTGVETIALIFRKINISDPIDPNHIVNMFTYGEVNSIQIPYSQIIKSGYSWNIKLYQPQLESFIISDQNKRNFKTVKLGDIIEYKKKSERLSGDKKDKGSFNFYISGEKMYKCNFADYQEESIIISSGGSLQINCDNNFSCSGDNFILSSKKEIMDNKLLYILIKTFYDKFLSDLMTGSTIKHLRKKDLNNLEITLPIKQFSEDEIEEIFNIVEINSLTSIDYVIKTRNVYLSKFKLEYFSSELKKVRLGDIVEYWKRSKKLSEDKKDKGQYNFYVSGEKVYKTDIADYQEESIIVSSGGSLQINYDNNFSCSGDNFILSSKKEIMNNKLLYVLIKTFYDKFLSDLMTGSTIKHLRKVDLNNLEIYIPTVISDEMMFYVNKIIEIDQELVRLQNYDEKFESQKKIILGKMLGFN